MFIIVRLLKGFPKPLTYQVPADWPKADLVGKIVHVPIQQRTTHAVVIKQFDNKPNTTFAIKEAHAIEPFPPDQFYERFIKKLSRYHQIEPLHFLKRIRTFVAQEKKAVRSVSNYDAILNRTKTAVRLTDEQQKVTDFVINKINAQQYAPTVLHGVTGSGKTECYKKMIEATIAQNKTALLLLPEVTLALQFEQIMQTQLHQEITIFGFHSATSARNKKLLWKGLLAKQPMLVIGVHLPILLPISNLGLIVVDEEHEVGYQEKKHPKINSKEAAIIRAHLHNIPIVLGSATPSVSSLFNVKKRGWHFFQLKKRFSGTFAKVKTVFLTDKKFRRNFWISQKLEDAIRDRLNKKEQTIIFLNRRGFSFFVQCKECSFIFECLNCSVSLTLHKDNTLTCHYCDFVRQLPATCPECKNKKATLMKKGIGTQQVVTILEKLFPYARIGRADLDTTRKKTLWQQTLQAFENRKLDILVGTQTITKGFHFPGVTLVGILWADLNLHFPIYNATESTLQQLIQVAGRAGRQSESSTVIVQSMSDHQVFDYLNEIDYLTFYAQEIENREMLGYPPLSRLVELELKHIDEQTVEREAIKLTTTLMSLAKEKNLSVQVLGPAQPPVSKIKHTHIRKIYLKSPCGKSISSLFEEIDYADLKSNLFYTPNPLS
ncbi:primosomal protein N' [Candidatus Dependentiae bacterium]